MGKLVQGCTQLLRVLYFSFLTQCFLRFVINFCPGLFLLVVCDCDCVWGSRWLISCDHWQDWIDMFQVCGRVFLVWTTRSSITEESWTYSERTRTTSTPGWRLWTPVWTKSLKTCRAFLSRTSQVSFSSMTLSHCGGVKKPPQEEKHEDFSGCLRFKLKASGYNEM